MPAAIALLWEVIGRGSDESRRGLALSMAFGAGPLLAVLGSFGQSVRMRVAIRARMPRSPFEGGAIARRRAISGMASEAHV